jgi:hypothetical protein
MSLNFDTLVLGPIMAAFSEENQGYPVPIYSPKAGGSFLLPAAVFDSGAKEVSFGGDSAPVSSSKPLLGVRLSLFPSGTEPVQDDQVMIRGKVYNVADVNADGHGHAKLILMEAEPADWDADDDKWDNPDDPWS